MRDNGSAATVLLGLDGFGLLAVSVGDASLSGRSRPPRPRRPVPGAGCRPGCTTAAELGARPTRRWPAGDLGMREAGLAVRRDAVSGADVDGDRGGDPAAGVVERTGPRRGMPPGRARRAVGGLGGPRVSGSAGPRSCPRSKTTAGHWSMTRPAPGGLRCLGLDETDFTHDLENAGDTHFHVVAIELKNEANLDRAPSSKA